MDRVKVHTQNLSKSLELSIIHVIEKTDVALLSMVDQAELQLARGEIDKRSFTDFISRLHTHMDELQGLLLADTRGDIIYGTGLSPERLINVADRDYFKHARDNPKSGVILAAPVLSRVTGQWVIVIGRRVNFADGSFAGVAIGSFPIDYFNLHFSTFNIGNNGTITLRNSELVTVARCPEEEAGSNSIGKVVIAPEFREQLKLHSNAGTFTSRSLLDQIERTYSYEKLSGYPLYISVGLATKDYLARWRDEMKKGLLLDATFLVTTSLFAWLLFRYWQSRRKAQEAVHHYYEHLEEVVKERTTELEAFNYAVSHDLRKPLTVISGYCGIIEDLYADRLDKDGRDYLKNIESGIDSMSALIDTLLNFARLTNCELERTTVNLSALALEVAATLRVAEPHRRVEFRIAAGIEAVCDRSLIKSVLENLLGNAWKYTGKQGEAIIEFGTLATAQQPTYFVRDNGAGFDMAEMERLFEPFQRLTGAQEYQGYGIGLSTVARIIKRHGGRIWAEGEPGKGASFYFTL